ncbi:MAG: hypothetical protein RI948_298 [Bacteroidota bacterium]|jgi:hypothetical protein
MKTNLYLLLILLSISTLSFAQRTLQIIHKKTGELLVIQEKEKVKINMYGILKFNGAVQILNDSTIQINQRIIPISNIKGIQYRKELSKAERTKGISLVAIGTGLMVLGELDFIVTALGNLVGVDKSFARPIILFTGGAASYRLGRRMLNGKMYNNLFYAFKIQG